MLQRLRVERLDDVVVDAGLLGRDHVVGLRLGGDHDEAGGVQGGIGADFPQQVEAGHRRHVPVRDDEPIGLLPHLGERGRAVSGVVDVLESELLEQVADDADHRVVVVDNEDRHRRVSCHGPSLRPQRRSGEHAAADRDAKYPARSNSGHSPNLLAKAVEYPVNCARDARSGRR